MTTDGFWPPLLLIVGDLAFEAQRRACIENNAVKDIILDLSKAFLY